MRTAMQFAYGICFRSVGCRCIIRRFECIWRSPGWWTALSWLLAHLLTGEQKCRLRGSAQRYACSTQCHALGLLSAMHAARVGGRSVPADTRLAALSCAQQSVCCAVLKFRVSSTSTARGVSL